MSTRARILAAVVVAVVAAATFGYYGFRAELASIRRRQDPQSVECKELIAAGYGLIQEAHRARTIGTDYCAAASKASAALDKLHTAQTVCRRYFDKDPMMTSDAALDRTEGMLIDFREKCARQ